MKTNNWFIDLGLLILSVTFSTILYIVFSIHYDTINPINWSRTDSFIFYMLIFSISVPLGINYIIGKYDIDTEKVISKYFDLNEYSVANRKSLDCVLAHYTNVATVGLFLMATIFMLRPYIKLINGSLFSLILAALIASIFFIYSLFLMRLAIGLRKYNIYAYFIVTMLALFFDINIMNLFIQSVPKP